MSVHGRSLYHETFVLRTVHTALPGRIVAALLALGLSGVPALAVERAAEGRPVKHRCHCPSGHHDCTCPICRSAARHARRADAAALPECHRALALEELAREEAEDARRAAGTAPCLRSSCDGPEERLQGAAGHDAFVLPSHPALVARGWATRVRAPARTPRSRAREPETPPPRRA